MVEIIPEAAARIPQSIYIIARQNEIAFACTLIFSLPRAALEGGVFSNPGERRRHQT
jgi:hypothetical protein